MYDSEMLAGLTYKLRLSPTVGLAISNLLWVMLVESVERFSEAALETFEKHITGAVSQNNQVI
jgi:hypothetical protein